MFGRPPVTALQEYCAKKGCDLPKYDHMDANDGTKSFVCSVEALDRICYGNGRSKREAKHDAAANLIKEVTLVHPDIMLIPQAPHETIPTTDAVMALRDLCVQKNHPLPQLEIIQQAGPAEAPEFTVQCQLASIKRYGVANTKKAARQKAALEVLQIIQSADKSMDDLQMSSLNSVIEEGQEERFRKLKTYRELTESGTEDKPGELLSDRHFFFEKFYDELRQDAKRMLNEEVYYPSERERVGDLFRVLKIKPKIKPVATFSTRPHLFMDLGLAYDVVFSGEEKTIYRDVLEYFKDMI